MNQPDICMIVQNAFIQDSRVHREASTLTAQGWQVVVVAVSSSDVTLPRFERAEAGYTVIRIIPRLFSKRKGKIARRLRLLATFLAVPTQLRQINARAYHGHDFMGLLFVGLAGIWNRPVVYDSHELYFDHRLPDEPFRLHDLTLLLRPIERVLARRAKAVIVVSEPVANWMAQKLGIRKPVVVQNAPSLKKMGTPATIYPTNGRKTVVHSGSLAAGRHLQELVASLAYLPNDIVLVLMGDGVLREALIEQATKLGVSEQLLLVPPVDVDSVAATLSQADVGVVLISTQGLHYDLTMANKFYETVVAGLPLVCSPTTAARAIMREYDLGILCDPTNPEAIANAIRTILEPETYTHYRANVLQAREVLNWETEEKKLIDLYKEILRSIVS